MKIKEIFYEAWLVDQLDLVRDVEIVRDCKSYEGAFFKLTAPGERVYISLSKEVLQHLLNNCNK